MVFSMEREKPGMDDEARARDHGSAGEDGLGHDRDSRLGSLTEMFDETFVYSRIVMFHKFACLASARMWGFESATVACVNMRCTLSCELDFCRRPRVLDCNGDAQPQLDRCRDVCHQD